MLIVALIIAKFTDEQYATINQSTAGRFNPRVLSTSYKCKQLTKTLGSKRRSIAAYCSSVNFAVIGFLTGSYCGEMIILWYLITFTSYRHIQEQSAMFLVSAKWRPFIPASRFNMSVKRQRTKEHWSHMSISCSYVALHLKFHWWIVCGWSSKNPSHN